MASAETLKEEYNAQGPRYDDAITSIPLGVLETQLLAIALGDCRGQRVLDLGGGSGLRARQALALGAASVDVVDLSPEMLRVGQQQQQQQQQEKEQQQEQESLPPFQTQQKDEGKDKDRITWHEADVSKPLDHLPTIARRKAAYDLVMANWVMDHAATLDALAGMWRNVATYLRPGTGRFVGTRCGDPMAASASAPVSASAGREPVNTGSGKYGVWFKDQRPIPGGYRYRYATERIDIEAASLAVSYSGSTAMHERFGLVEVETVPYEAAETVRGDPEFWRAFLDAPFMAVVRARKKG